MVYSYRKQWDRYLEHFFMVNEPDPNGCQWTVLRILSRYRIINLSGEMKFSHFNEVEKYLTQVMQKDMKSDVGDSKTLVLIDDVFHLKLFNSKKAAKLFLILLEKKEKDTTFT